MRDESRRPWEWPEGDWPSTLFGGLLAPARVDRDVVVEVLRAAVDLVNGWVGVDLTWSTFVDVVEDGVGNPRADCQRPGVDGEFMAGKPGTVTWINLEGVCTELAQAFRQPERVVVEISAHFPQYSSHHGRDVGRMVVGVSVQRWALYGSGQDLPWFTPALDRWMTQSAEALDAATGFALLDRVRASYPESPWERHVMGQAEAASQVWGYGWGTLLGPAQLDRVGGAQPVTSLPGAHVRELPGGRVWVTFGDNPSAVPVETMQALHEALLPALAERWVVDEPARPAPRTTPTTFEQLGELWRKDARTARGDGRESGMFGPVGYSLDVLELFAPLVAQLLPDCVVFAELGDRQAAELLARLPDAMLDAPVGPVPSLRGTFEAMVAHPGTITVSGMAFGPAREDEGLMVNQVRVHRDPVLRRLRPDDVEAAYRRLVELGVDASAEPEAAGPARDGLSWTFWWD